MAPGAYNNFMREELVRLKTADPTLGHKEAFKQAAANWGKQGKEARSALVATFESEPQRPITPETEILSTSKLKNELKSTLDRLVSILGYVSERLDELIKREGVRDED
jgi:hypothetical protein